MTDGMKDGKSDEKRDGGKRSEGSVSRTKMEVKRGSHVTLMSRRQNQKSVRDVKCSCWAFIDSNPAHRGSNYESEKPIYLPNEARTASLTSLAWSGHTAAGQ